MPNEIKHDLHAMLIELRKANCGQINVDELIQLCENNDPKVITANEEYSKKNYGKHITWCKSKFKTMGIKKAIGGNALLVFEALVAQALENNETMASYRELSDHTGLSLNTVKTGLQKCEEYGLIVTINEGLGSAPNVYKINPQLVLIGKYTNNAERLAISNFYKLTGSEIEYVNNVPRVRKSEAHTKFEAMINDFNETHVRGLRAYIVGDKQRIAGSFLTPEEAKKNEQKYKKSVSDDDETDEEDDYIFKNI